MTIDSLTRIIAVIPNGIFRSSRISAVPAPSPNPSSGLTHSRFMLLKAGAVTLKLYDIQGCAVATLADGSMEAGEHDALFSTDTLPGGIYFYRLNGPGVSESRTMSVVR